MSENGVIDEKQRRAAIKGAADYLRAWTQSHRREREALKVLEDEIEAGWAEIERLTRGRDAPPWTKERHEIARGELAAGLSLSVVGQRMMLDEIERGRTEIERLHKQADAFHGGLREASATVERLTTDLDRAKKDVRERGASLRRIRRERDAALDLLRTVRAIIEAHFADEHAEGHPGAEWVLDQAREAMGAPTAEQASRPAPFASLEARAMAALAAWKAAKRPGDDPEIQYPHVWRAVVAAVDATRPAPLTEAREALRRATLCTCGHDKREHTAAGNRICTAVLGTDARCVCNSYAPPASRGAIPADVRPSIQRPVDPGLAEQQTVKLGVEQGEDDSGDPGSGGAHAGSIAAGPESRKENRLDDVPELWAARRAAGEGGHGMCEHAWPLCVDCLPPRTRTSAIGIGGSCRACGAGGIMYEPREPWRPTVGARVVPTLDPARSASYVEGQRLERARLSGVPGVVIDRSDSHGLCFYVEHATGGRTWWDAEELAPGPTARPVTP